MAERGRGRGRNNPQQSHREGDNRDEARENRGRSFAPRGGRGGVRGAGGPGRGAWGGGEGGPAPRGRGGWGNQPRGGAPFRAGPSGDSQMRGGTGRGSARGGWVQSTPRHGQAFQSPSPSTSSFSTVGDAGDLPTKQMSTMSIHEPPAVPLEGPPSPSQSATESISTSKQKTIGTSKKGKKGGQTAIKAVRNGKFLPDRPGQGVCGEKVRIKVNCWDISIANVPVNQYDVQLLELTSGSKTLEKEEKRLRQRYLQKVIDDFGAAIFSDGGRQFYSLEKLIRTDEEVRSLKFEDPRSDGELELKYKINATGSLSVANLEEYLSNRPNTLNLPQDTINMFDNLLRWIHKGPDYTVSKSAIFESKPVQTENLMSIFRGFSLSVRPQWKIRFVCDMAFKADFPSGNLADILYEQHGENLYYPNQWQRICNDIVHLHVEASHYKNRATGRNYSKQHTIHGLSQRSAAEQMIPERRQSIAAYFQEVYGITLKYPELPCVKTKRDKEEYLPMELLTVLPRQNPKLDPGVIASAIIRKAAVPAPARFKGIIDYVKLLRNNRSQLLSKFNLAMAPEPLTIEARELEQPSADFHGRSMSLDRGKWNVPRFLEVPQKALNWAIVLMPPFYDRDGDFLERSLPKDAEFYGVSMNPRPLRYQASLAQLRQIFQDMSKKNVNIALFVLRDSKDYSEIKRLGELSSFMVTQCVKYEKLKKPNVLRNIMLKVNGKLGYLNWRVRDLPTRLHDDLLMVIGADVTHPGPTSGNKEMRKSVAAVVASISPDLMKYVAIVRQQDYKAGKEDVPKETIDALDDMFCDLVTKFASKNGGRLPTRVIFYRDGVSEGQFQEVYTNELCRMQNACRHISPDYEPGFTFIVVQKRHHIRFCPLGQSKKNVSPGTVVDREITHKREFDFYLCSQEGIQGTSKPAHYHVLYDDNDLKADELQLFTYWLCHAYLRCSRSVSYPAPTYYSHLAAFRARDWLKGATNPDSLVEGNRFKLVPQQQDLMFFL